MATDQPEHFEWPEALLNARVQFWTCPVEHPREPRRVTVEWDGDVATCTDCGRTNKDGG